MLKFTCHIIFFNYLFTYCQGALRLPVRRTRFCWPGSYTAGPWRLLRLLFLIVLMVYPCVNEQRDDQDAKHHT